MKNLQPDKKNVLLTGASGAIGTVLLQQLLDDDYNVIAVTRHAHSADKVANQYSSEIASGRLSLHSHDLCDVNGRDSLIAAMTGANTAVYGVINNARSLDTLKQDDQGHVSIDSFQSEFTLGIYAPYDLVWKLANIKSIELRRVVNISSIYGVVATNGNLYESEHQRAPLHYGVVKSALIHLTKELAVRLAKKQITVNAVSYGGVEGRTDEQFKDRYAKLCPQASMLSHSDLAGAVTFILSGQAKSITGHNLLVDGGWTIW